MTYERIAELLNLLASEIETNESIRQGADKPERYLWESIVFLDRVVAELLHAIAERKHMGMIGL